jgi:6-pyruvoyltetrahydropterin/6-carboxytetrahydropterin synthase
MYELTVETHFVSAHCLNGYKGKCSHIHGHTWLISATVMTGTLDDVGMSVDFKIIRGALEEIAAEFDHTISQ